MLRTKVPTGFTQAKYLKYPDEASKSVEHLGGGGEFVGPAGRPFAVA